jgi:hypothetical protein
MKTSDRPTDPGELRNEWVDWIDANLPTAEADKARAMGLNDLRDLVDGYGITKKSKPLKRCRHCNGSGTWPAQKGRR